MPVFIAALLGGLIEAAGTLVGRVLLSLGLGYVSYTALDTSLQWISDQISSAFAGLGSQSMAVLSACQVGSAVAIVLSAIGARLVLDGMTSGAVKKMVQR